LPPPAGPPVRETPLPTGPRPPLPPPAGPPIRDDSTLWPESRPADAPPETPPTEIRKGAIAAAVVVVLAAIALGFFVIRGNHHSSSNQVAYPSTWDARLAVERQFVQNERHVAFPHPVTVNFVTPDAYTQRVQALATSRTDAIESFLRLPSGVLRALGVAQGTQDLSQTAQQIDNARGAIYDPATHSITVRGTNPDESEQVQIVRALVLALDGQLYGDDTFSNSQAAYGYRAVREGDAQRVVDAYLAALDPAERQSIVDPYAVTSQSFSEPARVLEQATAVLGEQLVVQAQATGGERAIAALFKNAPFTQEQVYDPTKYFGEGAKTAPTPKLESGETSTGQGNLGNLVWLAMLGEHAPADSTVLASDGWGGDTYVTYQFQNKQCISTNWVGDTTQDVNEMTATLRQWTTAMSPGNAQFTNENNVVTVTACDPGQGASVTTGSVKDAYNYVAFRAAVFEHEIPNMPGTKAWCVAKQTAAAATPQDRTNPSVISSPTYATKLSQFEQACS
jgi:hypothetical protein